MMTILLWIFFSFIVGIIGSDKTIGFLGGFLWSLILSPVIGLIIVIVSKSNADVVASNKSHKLQIETLEQLKSTKSTNIGHELEKIAILRKEGIISDKEFELAKSKILQ